MNRIDQSFVTLANEIRSQNLEEIYTHIFQCYFKIPVEIENSLEDFFEKFPYWGKLKRSQGIYEELYLRSVSLKEHIEDFCWLYGQLKDYRSKKVLYAILNNWYRFDFETLRSCEEKNFSHYFDLDLFVCDETEVFVDLGAYVGDTIMDYLKQYGNNSYRKIYGYEVTEQSYESMKNTLSYYPNIICRKKAVSDSQGVFFVKKNIVDNSANVVSTQGKEEDAIEAVTLDEEIEEPITFLKMDIEGSESKALLGAKKHITEDHPKLAISVYHNHEDLWKIPKIIHEMWDGYSFYLRYYGNSIFPTEIVLFAVEK